MLLLPVLILDPGCGLVDLREECAFINANIFECFSDSALLILRNNEWCFANRIWDIKLLGCIDAVENEGTGLRENSPVAHLGMNVVWLKQIDGVDDWQEIWFFGLDKLMKSFYNAALIEFPDVSIIRYVSF